jgi:cytochrome c5
MNRRALLSTTALMAVPAALAACASSPAPTNSAVQSAFNAIQYALPLLDVLALGLSVAVPAAAPVLAIVEPYLGSAATVFQGMSDTMTAAAAQPIVAQIEGYLTGATAAVQKAITSAPAGSPVAAFGPKVAQAQAVLGLLTAFVNGVQAMPTKATVSLALLHK